MLFEPGRPTALAEAILTAEAEAPELSRGLDDYLKNHQADYVAAKYLEVMKAAIAKKRSLLPGSEANNPLKIGS